MNPLDTNEMFSIELMNPNPSSGKTKDGPVYRVSFEMTHEDWKMFMDANTKGMVLEMQGRVSQSGKNPILKTVEKKAKEEPEKKKGGPLSVECAMWCQDELPNKWARTVHGYDGPVHEHDAFKLLVYDQCKIDSRRLLDHDETAAWQWARIKNDFITWTEILCKLSSLFS